ncbi:MAG: BRCA1/BRCA2-containing complex subunit 3 [Monoraphidium minutum]|nr:MAG: BRCA1/BRCA2-containing complex subunit 3 [Monoraphidium minutum]
MSLKKVVITPEVFLACTAHALSTEDEEVMGLLLGDIQGTPEAPVAHIWRAVPQIRTDRRKDRVETSPEQMAAATALADQLTKDTGVRTRTIGWFHSHPHITVLPSHVDVATQALYQMLEPGFAGLIFSVYNRNAATKGHSVAATAFQSLRAGSPEAAAAAAAAARGGGGGGGGALAGMGSGELAGYDAATRDAIRAAAAESLAGGAGAAEWVRKEVPLAVAAPGASAGSALGDFAAVQAIILQEEQQAHEQRRAAGLAASASGARGAAAAPAWALMARLHDAGVHQASLCQLAEASIAPALCALRLAGAQAEAQRRQLAEEEARLQARLDELEAAAAAAGGGGAAVAGLAQGLTLLDV